MRLIDIDAINWYDDLFIKGVNHSGVWVRYRDVEHLIRNAYTVDAVPVVRCKDCKHCFVDGDNVRFNVCELNHNRVQADDWFCADGERKGGDE